jgi:hypothetical protein
MDLGGWLRSLGLGKYEAAFRDNAIDEKATVDHRTGIAGHRHQGIGATKQQADDEDVHRVSV